MNLQASSTILERSWSLQGHGGPGGTIGTLRTGRTRRGAILLGFVGLTGSLRTGFLPMMRRD